ncbi:drug/metabolite transporter superfamily protein YnfA [Alkalibacillus filiformis]|uniref:Drug/metabolite transporter superfamily protein YnfA n=1 Tax=Alkalibacillus filiformis TaxID=200990 RepID=A0ABU0DP53_9BACI|nr:hypothetical protein [Alkalibacillus filiformis]MDQ0350202.1 drug/metabolite transporter superfamily protein YnfA [Alkalibacillus filiformis]
MGQLINEPLIATTLIFALIAFGEWLSIKTRARVPMLLTAMVGYLILVWTGIFPDDLLERSQFAALGGILVAVAIVHMGTLIPMAILKVQYKAVIIGLAGVLVSGIIVISTVTFFFDYETAIAGVGPLSGGVVALIITSEKLAEIGLTALVVIPALVVAFQGILGMPLALNFMRRYAKVIQQQIDEGTFVPVKKDEDLKEVTSKDPVKNSLTIRLFTVFVGGAIAVALDQFTGIHYSLWALAIGIIGLKIGFYKNESLRHANSFTMTMIAIIFVVIGTMADVTPGQVLDNLPAILTILLIGTFGIALGGYVASKLVKWHPYKGMPVALTALFGFPGDYIVCEEVSRSAARNEEEEKLIFDELLSPMLIGGFTTVTVASVVIAGILIQTL